MATYINDEASTGAISEATSVNFAISVVEAMLSAQLASAVLDAGDIVSSLTSTQQVQFDSFAPLGSSGVAGEATSIVATYRVDLVETARIRDVAVPVLALDVVGSAASSTQAAQLAFGFDLETTAVAASPLSSVATLRTDVADSAQSGGASEHMPQTDLVQAVTSTQLVDFSSLITLLLTSTGQIQSGVDLRSQIVTDLLGSSAAAGQALSPVATIRTDVADELDGEEFIQAPGGGAWTASTDSFAMSRWTGYGVSQLAVAKGKLYGASAFDKKLYLCEGDTDAGVPIDATVTSFVFDGDDPRLKQARAVYFGHQSEQPLTVTVRVSENGVDKTYSYTAPPRVADAFVPGRVVVGRGMRYRYYALTLANTNGGGFTVDTMAFDFDYTTRRV